jgi:hypothetical protein
MTGRLIFILGAMALSSSTLAAGIDSRTYTCADLQGLIAARGFVFISQDTFGDFVVANASYCAAGATVLEWRSVATADRPECIVKYCVARNVSTNN